MVKSVRSNNAIDYLHDLLNTKIDVVPCTSEEFGFIEKYVKNTHVPDYRKIYDLKILNVFKIKRNGEEEKFKKLENRKLLWHGSRLANYAGILTNGLKIAPPEAPATGYMFGKGVYFADMVSKSAYYCHATYSHNIGLVLLCDVALGRMEETIPSS